MTLDQQLSLISKKLVFVVGSPRSGTTWLQRLLTSHAQICTGQESGLFDSYIGPQLRAWRRDLDPATSGRGGIGLGCYLTEQEFLAKLKGYLLELLKPMLQEVVENGVFLEKTPSHALYIKEILELLPHSKIIFVQRDPGDVVASLLAASKSWGSYWAPKNARSAALMWQQHVQAVQATVAEIPAGQYMEVRYEELVLDTPRILKSVFDFIGVDVDRQGIEDAILSNQLGRPGTPIPLKGEVTKSAGVVLQEPEGFIRKGRPGTGKDELTIIQRILVWISVHKTMHEVGYTWRFPWGG